MDSEKALREILKTMDPNPNRVGLKNTPKLVLEAWEYLTSGHKEDPKKLLKDALLDAENKNMVLVKDINYFSLCEHHLLPFFGKCHIAYIPNKKILGIGRIFKIVELFSMRLQIQERLTEDIAKCLYDVLKPKGLGVVIEGTHTCVTMRGAKKNGFKIVTTSMLGDFKKKDVASNFLQMIK